MGGFLNQSLRNLPINIYIQSLLVNSWQMELLGTITGYDYPLTNFMIDNAQYDITPMKKIDDELPLHKSANFCLCWYNM